ncbi:TOG domain-containing protein [[Candida] zeylanoides]
MSDEDYLSLSLDDRLVHKVWKVRLEAYEELTRQFEGSRGEKDECFERFNLQPHEFKKIVTDANVVAQESGILMLLKFLEFGGTATNVKNLRNAGIVLSLCEKGLSSSRAGTKDKTVKCLLMFVEITPEVDGVIEDLLSFVGARLPKLVAGCVNALAQIVANFGCQQVPVKLIIPHLAKLFAHADKNVRAETQGLTVELYKWMRDTLVSVLFGDLKAVQQKDLTRAFEKIEHEPPTQLRYTRRQQTEIERKRLEAEAEAAAAAAAAASATMSGEGEDVVMEDSDTGTSGAHESMVYNPLDLMDPVEILSKLPSDLSARISSPKWKDRKDVLDEVHAVLEKTVKIQPRDDYSELIRILAKCMKDANVQVVQLAANCLECLAKGLQTSFQRYQHVVLSPILERTKEKKASVAEALNDCLDQIFESSSLTDILDETLNGMKHKTPQVKIATTNFLQRCLARTSVSPSTPEIDAVMEVGVKLLTDSQEPVRHASTEMIGTLMKITGVRELNTFLEKVDDNRRAKVMEFYETVQVKAKKTAPWLFADASFTHWCISSSKHMIVIKQKETQILRLSSDLESLKLKIRDLEQSLEQARMSAASRSPLPSQPLPYVTDPPAQPTSPANVGHSLSSKYLVQDQDTHKPQSNRYSTQFLNEYPTSRITSGELSTRVDRLSIGPEMKDRIPGSALSSPHKVPGENLRESSLELHNNDDSWKRAAEVTSQLKARIEKMKARSRMTKLKILVPVKRVIDYAIKPRINKAQTGVEKKGVKFSINPFCDIALEESLRIREANTGLVEKIHAISVGPTKAQDILRTALAKGADSSTLVDVGDEEVEPLTVAKILQKIVEREEFNLVVLGKQAIDDDANQTGQMLAGLLNWPQATFASKVDIDGDTVTVTREVDGGADTLSAKLPMIITTDLRLNEPRYASLPNVMKAKKKPLEKLKASDLQIELTHRLETLKVEEPPQRPPGLKVESVDELVAKLKEVKAI